MKQYVQHISGRGEKWKVVHNDNDPFMWIAKSPEECRNNFLLPKTEYHLCEPPEEWENVTGACEVDSYSNSVGEFYSILHLGGLQLISADDEPRGGDCNVMYKKYGYRIRKINHLHNGPCFIVERKKS